MMPAYITGIILAATYFKTKWVRIHVYFAAAIHLMLVVQFIFYPIPIKSDDTWYGWKELAKEVEELKNEYPDHFVFSADGYKTTAMLNFYLDDFIYGQNVAGDQALHFDYIGIDLGELKGKNAIYIDSDPMVKNLGMNEEIPEKIQPYFNDIQEIKPIILSNMLDKPVRKVSRLFM